MKIVNKDDIRWLPCGTMFAPIICGEVDITKAEIITSQSDNGFNGALPLRPWVNTVYQSTPIRVHSEAELEYTTYDSRWFDLDDAEYGIFTQEEIKGMISVLKKAVLPDE